MSIVSGIVSVVKSILRIGGIIVPLLRGLRDMIPELDSLFSRIDDAVDSGEIAADDFFDRNLGIIGDSREFFVDLAVVAADGQALMDRIIVASQVETPDEVTTAEAAEILSATDALRSSLKDLVTKNAALEGRLGKMK